MSAFVNPALLIPLSVCAKCTQHCAHAVTQVADVLRSPYSKTASHAQPSQDGGTAAAGDNAVAATAKPGLGKAAAPNMAEGSINGPAPTGNAKDLQESAVMQQREGVVAREGQGASASQQQQGQAPQAQRQGQAQQQGAQHRVSPFAGAADRFSIDSGQPSHTSQHMVRRAPRHCESSDMPPNPMGKALVLHERWRSCCHPMRLPSHPLPADMPCLAAKQGYMHSVWAW